MSTAGQTSGKTCFKCQKPCDHITGLGLKDGRYVHNACFVCELCFVALPSTFVTKNGRHFHGIY